MEKNLKFMHDLLNLIKEEFPKQDTKVKQEEKNNIDNHINVNCLLVQKTSKRMGKKESRIYFL